MDDLFVMVVWIVSIVKLNILGSSFEIVVEDVYVFVIRNFFVRELVGRG